MKRVLVGFLFVLLLSGCAREPSAPAKDATGAAPTGQVLMVKVTGNSPTAFLSAKRGNAFRIDTHIDLPYEQTFNVRGSDRLEFAAGVENSRKNKTVHNIQIELVLDGKPVATTKEGEKIPYVATVTYTVPKR